MTDRDSSGCMTLAGDAMASMADPSISLAIASTNLPVLPSPGFSSVPSSSHVPRATNVCKPSTHSIVSLDVEFWAEAMPVAIMKVASVYRNMLMERAVKNSDRIGMIPESRTNDARGVEPPCLDGLDLLLCIPSVLQPKTIPSKAPSQEDWALHRLGNPSTVSYRAVFIQKMVFCSITPHR